MRKNLNCDGHRQDSIDVHGSLKPSSDLCLNLITYIIIRLVSVDA